MSNRITAIFAAALGRTLDASMSDEEKAQVEADLASDHVETLVKAGRINADPESRAAAQKLAAHDPDALALLLNAPRPAPAAGSVEIYNPNISHDPTQAAIEAKMKEQSIPYHEAALLISEGADLQP